MTILASEDRVQVLYLEDDKDARELVVEVLEKEGYDVWIANDVGAALGLLANEWKPDLILMDQGMPYLVEFGIHMERIEQEARRRIPTIVLEVFPNKVTRVESDGRVQKPFRMAMLLMEIERVFRDAKAGAVTVRPSTLKST
jgi:CheY-like chemotaxis protein